MDVALEGETSLLDKRFLDPACGSGIFLVGLFNRLAEEWKLKNTGARYDRRANGLIELLRSNLRGVDSNRSACQITAFSLYLALLDQLSPPGIRQFFGKLGKLPYLISAPGETSTNPPGETIRCADFFTEAAVIPQKANIIVGNPPWGSAKDRNTPAVRWCADRSLPHPDRQMATAFIWKAPSHLEYGGRVCFVLPHGTLFNHNDTAIRFQQSLLRTHAVDRVVNLTDYQFFLFEESRAPALVIRYRKEKPADSAHLIDYWAPKTDWAVTHAEILSILPQDRSRFTVREVLDDLKGDDAPLIWKERFWATPRDWRLLNRLSLMPRLRDIVGQPQGPGTKRWLIAEGFQPFGENDPPSSRKTLKLPAARFIRASHPSINLFILPNDCETLPNKQVETRRLIRNTSIFEAPHVLVSQGFSHIAFADFDVSFRHALRGIHGPTTDRDLLIFLAAYLRSDLARYFLFHTSSNWGVSRAKVHVEELIRLPFPLPDDAQNPKRCQTIVHEIAATVTKAAEDASRDFSDREGIVRQTQDSIGKLIEEYFDIDDIERMLITDTAKIIIPSVRPSRGKPDVPTIKPSNDSLRASYTRLLCDRLNGWAKQEYRVHGKAVANSSIGVGMVVMEKTRREEKPTQLSTIDDELLKAIDNLQRTAAKGHGTFRAGAWAESIPQEPGLHHQTAGATILDQYGRSKRRRRDSCHDPYTVGSGGSMTAGDTSYWDNFFQQNLIPAVLAHVISTWEQMHKPGPSDLEDAISDKLYSALVNAKRRSDFPFLIRREDLEFDTDLEKETGRKDIVFFPSLQEEEIYLCLEAKRLNAVISGVRRSLADEYVKEGMQRFVDGKYARFVRHGAMLAYVLDGDTDRAMQNVERNIRSRLTELRMDKNGGFLASTVCARLIRLTKETRHRRAHETAVFHPPPFRRRLIATPTAAGRTGQR